MSKNKQKKIDLDALATLNHCPQQFELRESLDGVLDKNTTVPIDENERKKLLRAVRKGEPVELMLRAVVSAQSKTPRPLPADSAREANRNFIVFNRNEMAGFADSFVGRQFLRDHDRNHMGSVGGEIVESTLDDSDERWSVFRQTVRLVKPWAVEAALDGTLKTFSIGWDSKQKGLDGLAGSLKCTVCGNPLFSSECQHFPGDIVKLESGESVIAEMEWNGVEGAETSAVSFPAVQQTAVNDIRAALSAARDKPTKEQRTMPNYEKLCESLGLAADATPEQILEAQDKQFAKLKTELKAEQVARESAQTALAALREEQKAEKELREKAQIEGLRERALEKGLMVPGDKRDELFLELAALDVAKGAQFLDTLEPAIPVGQPAQLTPPPADESKDRAFTKVLAEEYGVPKEYAELQKKHLEKLGLTEEDFVKHGQHSLWSNDEGKVRA